MVSCRIDTVCRAFASLTFVVSLTVLSLDDSVEFVTVWPG